MATLVLHLLAFVVPIRSAGKSKDMSAHQREEAQNGGCSPESILNYLEIWIRRPSSIYMAFSRGLGVKKNRIYVASPSVVERALQPTHATLSETDASQSSE